MASLEKIFGLFNVKETIETKPKKLTYFNGKITFKNVSFTYPTHPTKPVLEDISFDLNTKQTLAIVGPTGSGKSTLIKLLLGLYEGYQGSITFDDHEIKHLDVKSLRNHIVTVGQDTRLFNRSIAFNITLGNPAISDKQIANALELACATHILKKYPMESIAH